MGYTRFPPHPGPLPGERENGPPPLDHTRAGLWLITIGKTPIRRLVFPLPEGEGQDFVDSHFIRHSAFVIRISARLLPKPLPSFLRSTEGIVAPAHRSGQARKPRRSDPDINPGDDHMQQPGEQQSDEVEPIETVEKNPPTHQQSAGQLGRPRHTPAAEPAHVTVAVKGEEP